MSCALSASQPKQSNNSQSGAKKTKTKKAKRAPHAHRAQSTRFTYIKYQSVEEKSILVLPRIVVPLVTLESTVERTL